MGKMTLADIRKKVPDLQTKIADLTKENETENAELADIANAIEEAQMLYDLEKAKLAPIEAYVEKNKSNTSPKIQGSIKAQQAEIKQIKSRMQKQKDIIDEKQKRKDEITKEGSEYSKREAEVAECQKQIDEICDILVQDPTINAEMQKAIKIKFGEEIESKNVENDKCQKAKEGIIAGLKDDSKDGLKKLVEDFKKAQEEHTEATYDSSITDMTPYRDALLKAKIELENTINSKFGVTVSRKDIKAMMSALETGKVDELSLPSLEKVISETEAEVKKLIESRDKAIQRIESKKVVGDTVVTTEMQENQENIDRLNQEVSTLDTEIADIDEQMKKIDEDIKKEEEALGEPSEEYKDFQEAQKALKDEHIIPVDVVEKLLEDPKIQKKYEEFEKADLALREAFQACKLTGKSEEPKKPENEDRDKAIEQLKKAIENYQSVAKELADETGYGVESWHNQLLCDINERAMDGDKEVLGNPAYFHTRNQEFKLVLNDKEAMNGGKAIDEYRAVESSLAKIDDAQESILKGDTTVEADKLFTEADKGYFGLMDKFTEASGLEKGTGLFPGVTIYDLLKGENKMSKKPLNRIKGFFKRIADKFRKEPIFEISDKKIEVMDRYDETKTSSVEEEIERRSSLEKLRAEKESLRLESEAKIGQRAGKNVELAQAEKRKEELAKSAPVKSSVIEATEIDLMKVKYDETIIQAAVEKVERDDDDGRD